MQDDIIVLKFKYTCILSTKKEEILRTSTSYTYPAKNTSAGLLEACCDIIYYKDKIALIITSCQQQPRISM